jgi:hypothetical protein
MPLDSASDLTTSDRSYIHPTTYYAKKKKYEASPDHITAEFCHAPSGTYYMAHIELEGYGGQEGTDWENVTRKKVTWGPPDKKALVYSQWEMGRKRWEEVDGKAVKVL